jgi:hypothetical protein
MFMAQLPLVLISPAGLTVVPAPKAGQSVILIPPARQPVALAPPAGLPADVLADPAGQPVTLAPSAGLPVILASPAKLTGSLPSWSSLLHFYLFLVHFYGVIDSIQFCC